jgi:hypothetical protein
MSQLRISPILAAVVLSVVLLGGSAFVVKTKTADAACFATIGKSGYYGSPVTVVICTPDPTPPRVINNVPFIPSKTGGAVITPHFSLPQATTVTTVGSQFPSKGITPLVTVPVLPPVVNLPPTARFTPGKQLPPR